MKNSRSNTMRKKELHLVTGGGGYPGYMLGKDLVNHGHDVILFDVRPPIWDHDLDRMKFVQGSVVNYDELEMATKGVDCVYHMASFGMSGREQLNKKPIEAVNVGGTKNVIKACLTNRVPRLVYTSTYNVVFGGQEIQNGDEFLPYLPLDQHPDLYSKTKSVAEQIVLAANCLELRTCALRLAGVYGPEDQRHTPRIVKYFEQGLLVITAGKDTVQDFLHVENLVQGHRLAGEGLTKEKQYVAAGQAYFLCDGKPVNTMEFFRPLIEGLGYKMPALSIPVRFLYFIAIITEWVHFAVARVYNFQPILTRTEVYKSCVTHYFSINKAKTELGYQPSKVNDIEETLQHYIKLGKKKQKKKQSPFVYYLVNIILSLVFASFILSCLPGVK